jgi:hypothetical protein
VQGPGRRGEFRLPCSPLRCEAAPGCARTIAPLPFCARSRRWPPAEGGPGGSSPGPARAGEDFGAFGRAPAVGFAPDRRVAELPEESRRVFGFCLGRIYRVREIDGQGLAVLDFSADIDHRFGGILNDIRLEAEFLEEVPGVTRR